MCSYSMTIVTIPTDFTALPLLPGISLIVIGTWCGESGLFQFYTYIVICEGATGCRANQIIVFNWILGTWVDMTSKIIVSVTPCVKFYYHMLLDECYRVFSYYYYSHYYSNFSQWMLPCTEKNIYVKVFNLVLRITQLKVIWNTNMLYWWNAGLVWLV